MNCFCAEVHGLYFPAWKTASDTEVQFESPRTHSCHCRKTVCTVTCRLFSPLCQISAPCNSSWLDVNLKLPPAWSRKQTSLKLLQVLKRMVTIYMWHKWMLVFTACFLCIIFHTTLPVLLLLLWQLFITSNSNQGYTVYLNQSVCFLLLKQLMLKCKRSLHRICKVRVLVMGAQHSLGNTKDV